MNLELKVFWKEGQILDAKTLPLTGYFICINLLSVQCGDQIPFFMSLEEAKVAKKFSAKLSDMRIEWRRTDV